MNFSVRTLLAAALITTFAAAQTPATPPPAPASTPATTPQPAAAKAIVAQEPASKSDDSKKSDAEETIPVPPETSSVTAHDGTFGGRTVHYHATAGNLLIAGDDDKPTASIFYVAYTEDAADAATRPVTFFYNGGPGSSSIWLHMGSFGPVRVVTDSPQATGGAPYQLVPNPDSLLDQTDLVFIDAPATGYSRIVGKAKLKDFTGTDPDIKAFDRFILRYLTVNHRWNSPRYIFGESYGTTRSAGLADALQSDGAPLTGVILLSSILNYGIRDDGYDTSYISYLPTYAAIALYYHKVKPGVDMKTFTEQARAFASGPYAAALYQGDSLPAAERDAVAAKLAAFTGLSVDYLKKTDLRIDPSRFRKELLRDKDARTLGRYDARFEGWDSDAAGEYPTYDASESGISGAFVSSFHSYLDSALNFSTTNQYFLAGPGVFPAWEFKHKPPAGGDVEPSADTALDLADAMRKNPRLKVFSANGYFDLATPFFATEYDLGHMQLPPELRGNVQFGYYPSGHMVYLNTDALHQLRQDLAAFYGGTAGK